MGSKCKDDLNSLAEIAAALCSTKKISQKCHRAGNKRPLLANLHVQMSIIAAVELGGKQRQLHHHAEEGVAFRFVKVIKTPARSRF